MTRPFHHEFDLQVRRSVLPTAEKAVLFVLNTHADRKGFVARRYAPSMNQLASETSLSRRKVISAVKVCETEGWLVVHRPPIEQARTEHLTNAYELVIPASAHGALDDVTQDGASASGALGVVHDVHGAGAPVALKSAQPSQIHSAAQRTRRNASARAFAELLSVDDTDAQPRRSAWD